MIARVTLNFHTYLLYGRALDQDNHPTPVEWVQFHDCVKLPNQDVLCTARLHLLDL